MKSFKSLFLVSLFIACLTISSLAQNTGNTEPAKEIKWYTIQQAMEANKTNPKKIFIDVYTGWCGWCKKMDQSTFKHPFIVDYFNKNYYPVKFNAEQSDTVFFKGKVYVNPAPGQERSTHDFAFFLLGNKLSYPSYAFLDENFDLVTTVPGYLPPENLEPILKYFVENIYKKSSWEVYMNYFKGEIVPAKTN